VRLRTASRIFRRLLIESLANTRKEF